MSKYTGKRFMQGITNNIYIFVAGLALIGIGLAFKIFDGWYPVVIITVIGVSLLINTYWTLNN